MIDWERVVRDDGPAAWHTACRILGNRAGRPGVRAGRLAEAIELSHREAIGNCRALLLHGDGPEPGPSSPAVSERTVELTDDCPLPDRNPQPSRTRRTPSCSTASARRCPNCRRSRARRSSCTAWRTGATSRSPTTSGSPSALGMLLLRARRLKELLAPSLKGEND